MTLSTQISQHLQIPRHKIASTIKLLKEDNTIPFIARYRKEQTGNLDEEQIRNIRDELQRLENLQERRETILKTIREQGKLTDGLKEKIRNVATLTELEDLYQPYRPKRRTRGMSASEKGLGPLAVMILAQKISNESINSLVSPFLSDDIPDINTALQGASDIVAEKLSENAEIRQTIREKGFKYGKLTSARIKGAEDDRQIFELYYKFELPIKYLKPHQILAINRGENEKVLRVGVDIEEKDWRRAIRSQFPPNQRSLFFSILNDAIEDAAKRLLLPSIERDIRRHLTEKAEDHAIDVFSKNLHALLSQPPLSGHNILAIDPGFRTGSKVIVIDSFGKLLKYDTIYPHPPQNQKEESIKKITTLVNKHHVTLIVIGNGTASRETEQLIAEITKKDSNLHYIITSEAGASVYSASKLARKEFPDLDVSIRGAISIGRRVQDPLAELVKLDPKSIGVGLYQHDVSQTKLSNALDDVVESVVNAVGVEINSASPALLSHVAGIGPCLAEKIVTYREKNGPFRNRKELLNVSGMGPKTIEQSAGFLRIRDGDNPLDATAIHPESYPVAHQIYEYLNLELDSDLDNRIAIIHQTKEQGNFEQLAQDLNIGLLTLEDILDEIARPGRDPREDMPKPLLRKDILSMDDLSPRMQLKGTIRNVVDFGAFVDIGVKVDGLLHRSKIVRGTTLQVGDTIDVVVLSIDPDRNRIALDMKERDY
jgi:uncharacterized protein